MKTSLLRNALILILVILAMTPTAFVAHTQSDLSEPTTGEYIFSVIATTGQDGVSDLAEGVSINDSGTVAYIANISAGQGLFLRRTTGPAVHINPSMTGTRLYEPAVQINNSEMIIARDRIAGAPPRTFIRVWDLNGDSHTIASGPSSDFSSVDPFVTLSNLVQIQGNLIQYFYAFNALDESSTPLVVSGSADEHRTARHSSQTSLRPMITDNGSIVVRNGNTMDSAVQVHDRYLAVPEGIACVPGQSCFYPYFTQLGRSPGISDDGIVVAFSGVLNQTGAEFMGTTAGSGIFAAVKNGAAWEVTRLATQDDFSSFDMDMRVGVQSRMETDGENTATVVFKANNSNDINGLFTLAFSYNSRTHEFEVGQYNTLIKAGDQVDGLLGFMQDFSLYDPLNASGEVAFWTRTDARVEAIIRAHPYRRPIIIVPGIAGSFPQDSRFNHWLFNRGVSPEELVVDPLGRVYDDLIQTLKNAGYREGEDLFIGVYDWRMPPGPDPSNNIFDGHIDGIDATSITDDMFDYSVDYLGYWLRRATETWYDRYQSPLHSVDIIAHSTGGLVTRTYIQSDAYYAQFSATNGDTMRLPRINNFIMMGVPNRGASKAWNPLHDNWGVDRVYQLVLSQILKPPYKAICTSFPPLEIGGPRGSITCESLESRPADRTEIVEFLHRYVPTMRGLLATYPFLLVGLSDPETINSRVNDRNAFLLDLNNGLDVDFILHTSGSRDPNLFASEVNYVFSIFNSTLETPVRVQERRGPIDSEPPPLCIVGGTIKSIMHPLCGRRPGTDEIWYEDIIGLGDGTVPNQSSRDQFEGDWRVTLVDVGEFSPSADHIGLMNDYEVQQHILAILGFKNINISISTNLSHANKLRGLALASMGLDPVEGFLTDSQGRRLGYTRSTGGLAEIPDSVWYGDEDGIGWVFGQIEAPVQLELLGLGEDYSVTVYLQIGDQIGGIESSGYLALGEQRIIEFPFYTTIEPTATATMTPSQTSTVSNTLTSTSTSTITPANTSTITATITNTAAPTETLTPSETATNTATSTQIYTPTSTWTRVPTRTPTYTPSNTPLPNLRETRWIAAGSGSWHDAANWSTGEVPQRTDEVIIPEMNGDVTITFSEGETTVYRITCEEHLLVEGGTLGIDAASTVRSLTLDSKIYSTATFDGLGDLTITEQMVWLSGTLRGSGSLIIDEATTLTVSNPNPSDPVLSAQHYIYRRIDNYGTTNWTGGKISIQTYDRSNSPQLSDYGVFNNYGTFDVQVDLPIPAQGQAQVLMDNTNGIFNNVGTFTKSMGQGAARLSLNAFNNSGTVQIKSGSLILEGGFHSENPQNPSKYLSNSVSNGSFIGDENTVLVLGTHLLQDGASIQIPNVDFASTAWYAPIIFESGSSYEVTENTTCSSGNVSFESGAIFINIGELLTINGCSVTFDQETELTVGELRMQSGNIYGSGDISVASLLWTGGHIWGQGRLTIPENGTMIFDSSSTNPWWLTRSVVSNGITTWRGGNLGVGYLQRPIVDSTGRVTGYFEEIGNFTNNGSMDVEGDVTIEGIFNNMGIVTVYSGHLRLTRGGAHPIERSVSSGVFNGADGTALTLQLHTLSENAVVSGFPDVTLNNVTFERGSSYEAISSTTIEYSTVTFDPEVNLISLGNQVTVRGTLDLNIDHVVFENVDLHTEIIGSSDLTVNGTLNWFNGYIRGTGNLIIPEYGLVRLDTPYPPNQFNYVHYLGRTLENYGTFEWIGGRMYLEGTGILNNYGIIELQVDVSVPSDGSGIGTLASGNGLFINHSEGELIKSIGDGEAGFQLEFHNEGTVRVNSGRLAIVSNAGQDGRSSGQFIGAANTVLILSGHVLEPSSAIRFADGEVTFIRWGFVERFGEGLVETGAVHVKGVFETSAVRILTGGVDFDTGSPVMVQTLFFERGILRGTSDVIVENEFTWSIGGEMVGPGRTISKGQTTFVGVERDPRSAQPSLVLNSRILEVSGTTVWSSGSMGGANGGGISNTGVIEITGNASFRWCRPLSSESCELGTEPTFTNAGIMIKSGTGMLSFQEYRWDTDAPGSTHGGDSVTVQNSGDFIVREGIVAFENFNQSDGTLQLVGGSITTCTIRQHWTDAMRERCGMFNIEGGELIASGSLTGNVTNGGTLRLGESVEGLTIADVPAFDGTTKIGGNFTQTATGSVEIHIEGPIQHNRLTVAQSATLNGSINPTFADDYLPMPGEQFTVITFASGVVSDLSSQDSRFQVNIYPNSIVITMEENR